MSKCRCYEELSFFDALKAKSARMSLDDSQSAFYKSHAHNSSYISRGYFFSQINYFLKQFPKKNIRFFRLENSYKFEFRYNF